MNKKSTNGSAAAEANISILTDPVAEFNCSKCDCLIDVRGLPPFTRIECPKCSSRESVPARLGNFLLLKLLGTGGMGGVYYAKDETLGRFVAIKVMLQKLGNNPEFIETFRREARAVAKLNHPNIAQIYSFGQEKGQPYIVMELVNGEHVDEMMEEPGGIPLPLAIRITLEVAQGLSAADEAGIVHGDIKPENIMLDKNGRAKLVDFGLATVAHAAAEEGIWGTPYYIAPEKLKRQKVDARADIYSLGASLYHILAGKPPFDGDTPVEVVKARLNEPAPDLSEVRQDLPDLVVNIVKRMLEPERSARYPTYKSLIGDLRKALNEIGDTPAKTNRFGGKHIRIKNKKSRSRMLGNSVRGSSSTTQDNLTHSSGGKKKIVIRKDKPSLKIKTSGSKSGSGTTIKADSVKLAAEHKPKKKPVPVGRIFAIIFSILGLLIIGGVTIAIVMHHRETVRKRQEYFALDSARKTTKDLHAKIKKQAEKVEKQLKLLKDSDAAAREAVQLITDSPYVDINAGAAVPPEVPASTNAVAAQAAAGTNANVKVAADVAAAAKPDQPEGKKNADKATKQDEDATAANTNKAVNITATDTNKVAEVEEPAVSGTEDFDDADPVLRITKTKDKDLPSVVVAARDVIENMRKLQTIQKRLAALEQEAARAIESNARKITSKKAKALNAIISRKFQQSQAYYDSAQALVAYIKTSNEKIEKQASERRAEIERQKKAEEEAARLQAEEERKQREREEHEALVKSEMEQVKLDRSNQQENFILNDYATIVKNLKNSLKSYQSDEAKDALKIIIDRYAALETMQKELIDCINKNRFSWGWGSGASARDIVKASERGLTLNDSAAVHPWKAVGTFQMLKMINHYIELRDTLQTTKKALAMGAAIYCDEHSRMISADGNEKAQKMKKGAKQKAKTYLNKAIGFGYRQTKANRLMGDDYL